uniref:Uncharacterized protein n=1 Tax=Anopheles atroparvus TaxID=41427 RepID=A0A182IKE8_ANOAO
MQVHLIKCEKQHPKAAVKKCLFNFTHHIRNEDYSEHLRSCPDRRLVDSYSAKTPADVQEQQAAARQSQPTDPYVDEKAMAAAWGEENWDDMDEKPYKPADYCLKNDVIRSARNLTKSEKREFYESESIRRAELKKNF